MFRTVRAQPSPRKTCVPMGETGLRRGTPGIVSPPDLPPGDAGQAPASGGAGPGRRLVDPFNCLPDPAALPGRPAGPRATPVQAVHVPAPGTQPEEAEGARGRSAHWNALLAAVLARPH